MRNYERESAHERERYLEIQEEFEQYKNEQEIRCKELKETMESIKTEKNQETKGVQTEEERGTEMKRQAIWQEINAEVEGELNDTQLSQLLKKSWPESIYKKCKIKKGPLFGEKNEDIIIIRQKGDLETNEMVRRAVKDIPLLGEFIKEREDKIERPICYITDHRPMSEEGMPGEGHTRYTFVVTVENVTSLEGIGNWCKSLERVTEIMDSNGRKNVECITYNTKSEDMARKHLERLLRKRDTDVQAVVYNKGRDRLTSSKKSFREDDQPFWEVGQNRKEETIFVKPLKQEGAPSYAELLKIMKEKVKVDEIQVNGVSRTKDGAIQIRIRGHEEAARTTFKNTLKEKMAGCADMEETKKMKTILLLDIDAATDLNEIASTVAKETGIQTAGTLTAGIQLASKENIRGRKHAFVILGVREAEALINKKRIGEGWNRWRVKEIFTLPRCFRCKKIGHTAKECVETGGEVCHNCGEMGHMMKNCKNGQACYLCKCAGHRTESMKCPKYKKTIQDRQQMGAVFGGL